MRKILFREAVIAFMHGESYVPYEVIVRRNKTGEVGGYCGGRYVEECRRTFGDMLSLICSSCPE